MAGDPRLIGLLTRALNHELSAVQQYLAQARLAELWGDAETGRRFRDDVAAELRHADQLLEALLSHGAAPGATQLSPVRLAADLRGILETDRRLELEAVHLYEEAAQYCARLRNAPACELFKRILEDEISHIKELDEWLSALPKERTYA